MNCVEMKVLRKVSMSEREEGRRESHLKKGGLDYVSD